MSNLGGMIERWVVIDEVGGFQCKFIKYKFKEYNAQDYVQVSHTIQDLVRRQELISGGVTEIIL